MTTTRCILKHNKKRTTTIVLQHATGQKEIHSTSAIRVSSIRVDPELFGKIRVGNPEGAQDKS